MRVSPYAVLQKFESPRRLTFSGQTQAMSARQQNATQKLARRAEDALLVLGMALLTFWGAARVESIIHSPVAVEKFYALDSRASVSADSTREPGGTTALEGNLDPRDGKKIQSHIESSAERKDVPLAVLRIPKIHLEVPLLEGTDSLTLNHAVGRIAGTARPGEPGNIGIAGHRDGFFRGLKDVTVGDTVELRIPTGTIAYKVDEVSIVAPQDVSVLNPKAGPSLTLVTCYPFYFIGNAPQRYVVSASPAQAPEQGVRLASIRSVESY